MVGAEGIDKYYKKYFSKEDIKQIVCDPKIRERILKDSYEAINHFKIKKSPTFFVLKNNKIIRGPILKDYSLKFWIKLFNHLDKEYKS